MTWVEYLLIVQVVGGLLTLFVVVATFLLVSRSTVADVTVPEEDPEEGPDPWADLEEWLVPWLQENGPAIVGDVAQVVSNRTGYDYPRSLAILQLGKGRAYKIRDGRVFV